MAPDTAPTALNLMVDPLPRNGRNTFECPVQETAGMVPEMCLQATRLCHGQA